MRSASLSGKVFGVYVIVTGIALLLVPNLLLSLFGLPAANEIWVRVLGALAIVTGYYYWVCGQVRAPAFLTASVSGRFAFAALCLGLVVGASAPWQLLIFGAVDVLGAVWTAYALRSEPVS